MQVSMTEILLPIFLLYFDFTILEAGKCIDAWKTCYDKNIYASLWVQIKLLAFLF